MRFPLNLLKQQQQEQENNNSTTTNIFHNCISQRNEDFVNCLETEQQTSSSATLPARQENEHLCSPKKTINDNTLLLVLFPRLFLLPLLIFFTSCSRPSPSPSGTTLFTPLSNV